MLDHMFGGAPVWLWLVFHLLVFTLLAADSYLTRGTLSQPTITRRSYWLTALWLIAAMLFALLVFLALSRQYALEYLTGSGIEEALSIDNLFVFLILFRSFRLEPDLQRRVLFFGVMGAIVMRAAMIFAGIRLLNAFTWMNYIFGAILLYTAWHLLRESLATTKTKGRQPSRIIAWLSHRLPMAASPHDLRHRNNFFVRENGRLRFTPLFLALLAIEGTDLIFATDSIPAVLAVSHHPFVVYSSNIFAVLGLRSLYFTLAAGLDRLHKLRYGLVFILAFVGLKMMLARIIAIPIAVSLAVLAAAVLVTAVWSLLSQPGASHPTQNQ